MAPGGADGAGGGPGMKGPGGPGMKGPGGPGGPPAIDRAIEEATGKPLTDDQKKQIGEAAKKMHEAVQAAREAFVQQVATISGLTVDQVREALPQPPGPGGPGGGRGGPGGGRGDGPPPPHAPPSGGAAK